MGTEPTTRTTAAFTAQQSFLLDICEVIDTPRSLAVALLVGGQAFGLTKSEADLTVDLLSYLELPTPVEVDSPKRYAEDRLCTELLRKSDVLPIKVDRREAALSTSLRAEALCAATNHRLTYDTDPLWFESFRRWVATILGELDFGQVLEEARHGPGAAIGFPGDKLVRSLKYTDRPTATPSLAPFAESIMGSRWQANAGGVVTVDHNKWVAVPKSAKTDRAIAVEPLLNVYVQLGLGEVIRQRLLRFGCDLRDQKRNQSLAARAYAESLATIDLSMASDTVSRVLVSRVLPPRWAHMVNILRAPYSMINGKKVFLEKHSSMGNGYTFPLESLLFLALVFTFVPRQDRGRCGVYGDDIIVPQHYAHDLIQALEYLGFSVNVEKSFLAGRFFESCGTDFYLGHDVRPFYLRNTYDTNVPKFLQWANSLRRWLWRVYGYSPEAYRGVWLSLIERLNHKWRKTAVPEELGDAGVLMSLDESRALRWRKGPSVAEKAAGFVGDCQWEGFAAVSVIFLPTSVSTVDLMTEGVILAALHEGGCRQPHRPFWWEDGLPVRATNGREPVRGLYGRPLTRITHVRRWTAGPGWY